MSRFRPILHEHGLSEQQWRVLRTLDERGALTAAKLAADTTILAPSMTRILRRLTTDRLVSASRSRVDQRERVITITATGKRLVARISLAIEAEYAAIRRAMGKAELVELTACLDHLIALGTERV